MLDYYMCWIWVSRLIMLSLGSMLAAIDSLIYLLVAFTECMDVLRHTELYLVTAPETSLLVRSVKETKVFH